MSKTLFLGNSVYVQSDKVVSISEYGIAMSKKLIEESTKNKKCHNASGKKAAKTVVLMEDDYVFISSVNLRTLISRWNNSVQEVLLKNQNEKSPFF